MSMEWYKFLVRFLYNFCSCRIHLLAEIHNVNVRTWAGFIANCKIYMFSILAIHKRTSFHGKQSKPNSTITEIFRKTSDQ